MGQRRGAQAGAGTHLGQRESVSQVQQSVHVGVGEVPKELALGRGLAFLSWVCMGVAWGLHGGLHGVLGVEGGRGPRPRGKGRPGAAQHAAAGDQVRSDRARMRCRPRAGAEQRACGPLSGWVTAGGCAAAGRAGCSGSGGAGGAFAPGAGAVASNTLMSSQRFCCSFWMVSSRSRRADGLPCGEAAGKGGKDQWRAARGRAFARTRTYALPALLPPRRPAPWLDLAGDPTKLQPIQPPAAGSRARAHAFRTVEMMAAAGFDIALNPKPAHRPLTSSQTCELLTREELNPAGEQQSHHALLLETAQRSGSSCAPQAPRAGSPPAASSRRRAWRAARRALAAAMALQLRHVKGFK